MIFPKPKSLGSNVKFELDLSNYGTKADLKKGTGVDTSNFVKKTALAKLKYDVDKSDISKLEATPVDLSKLNDLLKNEVVKKTEYSELVKKVNNINASSDLAKKIDYNTKVNEI